MLGNRGSGFDTEWLLTNFHFSFNLVEENSLIVLWGENSINCLRSGDIDSGDAVLAETSERKNVTRGLAARQAPEFEKMAEISSFW